MLNMKIKIILGIQADIKSFWVFISMCVLTTIVTVIKVTINHSEFYNDGCISNTSLITKQFTFWLLVFHLSMCAKPKKAVQFILSVGVNHLYLFDLLCGLFLSVLCFQFGASFDWLIPLNSLIHSNKRILFFRIGVNQCMELFPFHSL